MKGAGRFPQSLRFAPILNVSLNAFPVPWLGTGAGREPRILTTGTPFVGCSNRACILPIRGLSRSPDIPSYTAKIMAEAALACKESWGLFVFHSSGDEYISGQLITVPVLVLQRRERMHCACGPRLVGSEEFGGRETGSPPDSRRYVRRGASGKRARTMAFHSPPSFKIAV